MHKVLVVCGPTAVGKTSLALRLAKQLNGELISADSRQVYRYLNIGTGKEGKKVWLYDVAGPKDQFNVADYVRLTRPVIEDIWQRKKLPIVVGGTGFYIKALVEGVESLGVEPDWELRRELEKLSVIELQDKLKSLMVQGFNQMNQSDQNNPRRLIRKIEIIKNFSPKADWKTKKLKIDSLLMIGLKAPKEILFKRIEKRVDDRVKEGMEKEIRGLLVKGYNWRNSVMGVTLGYQQWQAFFEERQSQEAAIAEWKRAEKEYARRQMTWFKKDKRVIWLDISLDEWENKLKLCLKKSKFLAGR
ncbi:MAG: tRNA (adenosine(37)-N6)-dimethylallyltransferase MiaA [Candidatus Shapirobacteria bacterium]